MPSHPTDDGETVTVTLSAAAQQALEEIMVRSGSPTPQQAIGRALSNELFLLREREDGWDLKLQIGQKLKAVYWGESPTSALAVLPKPSPG